MKRKAVRNYFFALLFFFVSLPVVTEVIFTLRKEGVVLPSESVPLTEQKHSLLYVGDIMLGRNVEKLSQIYGADFAFKNIKPLLFDNTYVIANLEGPILPPENHSLTPRNGFSFNFTQDVVQVLSLYHISAVSLANNHTSDQGEYGYSNTKKILSAENIAFFGHSRHFSYDYISHYLNQKKVITVGVNLITPFINEKETISGINSICEQNKDATVFAFIHAGTEYIHDPSGYQVTFAHKLIDETCVRTVIGSHPHVVQGIENYKGHYIFYSLGNFIFDQYFSEETQEGYALKVTFEHDAFSYTILPIYQEMSAVKLAKEERKDKIIRDILSHSPTIREEDIFQDTLSE